MNLPETSIKSGQGWCAMHSNDDIGLKNCPALSSASLPKPQAIKLTPFTWKLNFTQMKFFKVNSAFWIKPYHFGNTQKNIELKPLPVIFRRKEDRKCDQIANDHQNAYVSVQLEANRKLSVEFHMAILNKNIKCILEISQNFTANCRILECLCHR